MEKSNVKIIFGLGNPGLKYKHNRHNAGYMAIEKIGKNKNSCFKRNFRLNVSLTGMKVRDEEVILIKPSAFMNNSGVCVRKVLTKYNLSKSNILVVHDDVNLPLGTLRFREKGSCGGHNGMASIIEELNSDEIARLRIGIDEAPNNIDLADYVLSDFTRREYEELSLTLDMAEEACINWVIFGNKYVMNKYNSLNVLKGGIEK